MKYAATVVTVTVPWELDALEDMSPELVGVFDTTEEAVEACEKYRKELAESMGTEEEAKEETAEHLHWRRSVAVCDFTGVYTIHDIV